jgi:choline monooxygenase
VRDAHGTLRAFYNVCQHRGHRIVEGAGVCEALVCPYHAWTYELNGRASGIRGAPAAVRDAGIELKPVRIEEAGGLLYVNLDAQAESMARDFDGLDADLRAAIPALGRLRFAKELSYDIGGNWKAAVENVLECYHCPVAHPAFCDLVDMPRYDVQVFKRYSKHIGPARKDGRGTPYSVTADRSADTEVGYRDDYLAWFVWPNVMLNRFPGRDNLEVIHILPAGPESVRQIHHFYFVDGVATNAELDAVRYVDDVLQPEDNTLVESVQSGYRSAGYETGWYVMNPDRLDMNERAVKHFHGMIREAHAWLDRATVR